MTATLIVTAKFVEATVVFVIMQMSLGLILNVIVGFSVVDGRWRGREAILDLDFTISHRCKCQFCQKRFSLRVLALRRVCKQMTIVAMRPCCKTGAKVVLRRSTTLMIIIITILNNRNDSFAIDVAGYIGARKPFHNFIMSKVFVYLFVCLFV